jgi:hypothetical protein
MSTSTIDFSKYEQPVTQIDFSKYEAAGSNPVQQSGPDSLDEFDTLRREASSLGNAITGMPSTLYHSFADKPQNEEEKRTMAEHPIVGRAAMGLGRIMVDPIKNAAQWYGQAAKGQIPDPMGQALSVAPEAIGSAAGNVLAAKGVESAPGMAKGTIDIASQIPSAAKIGLRGVGKIARAGADVIDPDITGIISPRLAHAQRVAGRIGKVLRKESPKSTGVETTNAVPKPGISDAGLQAKVALPDPRIDAARGLGIIRPTGAAPAAQTGESLGTIPTEMQRLTPISDAQLASRIALPDRTVAAARGLGIIRPTGVPPASQTGEALGTIQTPGQLAMSRLQPLSDEQVTRAISLPSLEDIKPPSPRVESSPATTVPAAQPGPARPVTENPIVGSLVRAMQESGVPIAKRPNLLLKGSGRVNRILGPEEDLSDILRKSLRQAGRKKDQ